VTTSSMNDKKRSGGFFCGGGASRLRRVRPHPLGDGPIVLELHFRILKTIAICGFLTALECTKFVFGQGSGPHPAGRAYSAPPDPVAGLRGNRTSKGEWTGREEKGDAPLTHIPGAAPEACW